MKNRLTISIAGVMALSIPDIVKAQNLFVSDFTAATSMNLRRAECKAPLPPGCIVLTDWPLTARVICLWRIKQRQHL